MRETRRVCYIRSIPEWFSHTVNDMFFREQDWIFVPVQDLSEQGRFEEYRTCRYFFVSGYGNPEEARQAHTQGCILVGVRADVDRSLPMIECKEWDPVDAYTALKVLHILSIKRLNPWIVWCVWMGRSIAHPLYLLQKVFSVYRAGGIQAVYAKARSYRHKKRT